MHKKWVKISIICAILGYLVFSIFAFSFRSKNQVCKAVLVEISDSSSLRFITKRNVVSLLDRSGINPVGGTMKDIRTDQIEMVLEKQPRIKQAECYKTPDGKIKVVVKQREPILRIMNNGHGYYVDSEGKTMPISSDFTAYVPVASGAISEKFAKNELYDFALFLKRNKFWDAQIEQIYVDYNEEVELVPRVGDHIIALGKLDSYEYKLEKLMSVYKDGFSRTGWNKYRRVDLRYENQVVCTKR
ncbi:MAG: cell division protein FtsQ [Prevotellaceae bacterium]|nr:cell division protein FtsQ [Prevotellaceae bacterium]